MKKNTLKILEALDAQYGREYVCYLDHENAWQLLIATMLSAQCTDARVNIVTKDLFQKYRSVEDFAKADLKELEKDIHSTGFYHNKAKNIIACCNQLLERHGGEVPSDIESLTALAGVGRKTANVIRGNIFNEPSIVVDTHVKRISKKLGLTKEEDPVKVEMDLMKELPKDHWILYNIQIITLGRTICKAPTPKCEECFLQEVCPEYKKTQKKKGSTSAAGKIKRKRSGKIMIKSYVSIDLETTGLNPKTDKIIEIGAVKVIDGQVAETYHTYINPGRKLEERITELTGILQEQVDSAPVISEVFSELEAFLGDLPLLGHRILFDYSFLKKAAVDLKKNFEKQGIDTLRIARCFLPQLEHRTLPYLCEYYKIEHEAHRALADAEATGRLYEILCREYFEQDGDLFKPQQLIFKVKKDTPATKAQKEQLYRLIDQYKLEIDYDVEKLSRSEASRIKDKIRTSLAKS